MIRDPGSLAAAGGTVLILARRVAAHRRHRGDQGFADRRDVALATSVRRSPELDLLGPLTGPSQSFDSPLSAYCRSMADDFSAPLLRNCDIPAVLLALTLLAMSAVWLVARGGHRSVRPRMAAVGVRFAFACALAAASYQPTLARYGRSPLWSLALPLIAVFYMAATVSSALNHWRGRGARWKNRAYGSG